MAPPSRQHSERSTRERAVAQQQAAMADADINLSFDANQVPAGRRYKWIRELILGQHDRENVSKRLRQGYVPVLAEDHPGEQAPCLPGEQPDPLIRRGGCLLMALPEEVARAEDAHLRAESAQAMFAVDADRRAMARQTTGAPAIAEESTTIARGRFEER